MGKGEWQGRGPNDAAASEVDYRARAHTHTHTHTCTCTLLTIPPLLMLKFWEERRDAGETRFHENQKSGKQLDALKGK